MNSEDDPEARIRELERGIANQAQASELGTGQGNTGSAYLPPPVPGYTPPGYNTQAYGSTQPYGTQSYGASSPTARSRTAPSFPARSARCPGAFRGWCSA